MGLRLLTGLDKRRDEWCMRKRIVRIDRDRPAGPFDRLIILLQSVIVGRFLVVERTQTTDQSTPGIIA